MSQLPREQATAADVAGMLAKALEAGLAGKGLPISSARFTSEEILYINTVYDKARNNARPSRVPATRKS